MIFELIVASEIYKRFDTSHEFWSVSEARKPHKKKKLGYYKIERIVDPCILTLAVNPKEYLEIFESKYLNKKHKGIKTGSSGLGFKNFSKRIGSLVKFDTFKKNHDMKQVSRLTIVAGEMVKTITKNKFSQLNDKRSYFPYGVISLPFHHPLLVEIETLRKIKTKNRKIFLKAKRKFV